MSAFPKLNESANLHRKHVQIDERQGFGSTMMTVDRL